MYTVLALAAFLLIVWSAVVWASFTDEEPHPLAEPPSDCDQKAA